MTTIRVKDYMEDEDADEYTSKGVAFVKRLEQMHRIDDTVKLTGLVKVEPAATEGENEQRGE